MKKIFSIFIIALLSCLTISAQTAMRVNKTNGSSIVINIDEIESIDFPSGSMVYLNQMNWYLHPQQTCHIKASVVEDKVLTEINANWSTSNAGIATVDATGCITGVAEGTATITAEYLGETATMTVNVIEKKVFDISVTDITNTSCKYSITPKDPSVRYYYNMRNTHGDYSIDSMDQYGSVEENVYHFTLDWYEFMASSYGDRTWNEAMQPHLQEGTASGSNTEFYSVLVPGTEYTIYAMGFDEDGYITTPIETYVFETTTPAKSDMTFDITINRCLSSDAQFTVTPSNNDEPYLVCVQRANYVEWFVERDRIDDMAQPMVESFAKDTRYPAIQRGPVTLLCSDFVNVRTHEDYYVIVFGYNDGVTTPVSIKHFKTESGWTEPEGDVITVTPPTGLTEYPCTFNAIDVYEGENGETVEAPIDEMGGYVIVDGNKVYFYGVLGMMTDYWTMGTYDAATKTLTMPFPQNLGTKDLYGQGPEPMYLVGGDMNTGKLCDLTFHYNPGTMEFTLDDSQYFVVNGKPFDWNIHMMLWRYKISLTQPLF